MVVVTNRKIYKVQGIRFFMVNRRDFLRKGLVGLAFASLGDYSFCKADEGEYSGSDKTKEPKTYKPDEMVPTYEEFKKWFDSDYEDKKVLKKLEIFHRNYRGGLKKLSNDERKEVKEIQEELNGGGNLFRKVIIEGYQKNYPFLKRDKNGNFGEDDAYFVYEEFKALSRYQEERIEKDDDI